MLKIERTFRGMQLTIAHKLVDSPVDYRTTKSLMLPGAFERL